MGISSNFTLVCDIDNGGISSKVTLVCDIDNVEKPENCKRMCGRKELRP